MDSKERGCSVLDRSVKILLPHPDETPSGANRIDPGVERLHRLHGTSLLGTAWILLLPTNMSVASCFATSCTLLHRFYHAVSLSDCNVWSVAMASTLLAAKLHDEVLASVTAEKIILTYSHLYRRRVLMITGLSDKQMEQIKRHSAVAFIPTTSNVQPEQLLRPTGMSPLGPIYKEWYDALIQTENKILRALGFTIYWIPESLAHKFVGPWLQALVIDDEHRKAVNQRAWNYCNDAYRMDLMTRVDAAVVASAAIYLAVRDVGPQVVHKAGDSTCQKEWFKVLCGDQFEGKDVALVCNALLSLQGENGGDVLAASFAFVRSLEPKGSFNDPDSFLWEMVQTSLGELREQAMY